MRFFILAVLLIVPVANADVIINGTRYQTDEVRINFTEKGSEPAPVPEPQPTPVPTPPSEDCRPSGNRINWAEPGARKTLSSSDNVISFSFTTTSNPSYAGAFNVAEVAGYEDITREVWFSKCPNGDVVHSDPRCKSEGISSIPLRWSQRDNRFRCSLQTNTGYHLNIRQKNCQGTCSFYLSPVTNNNP